MQTQFILVEPLPIPRSSPQATTHLRFSSVFGQELFREHLTIKFSLKDLSLPFRNQTYIYIGPLCLPFQDGLNKCVFSKSFSKIFKF